MKRMFTVMWKSVWYVILGLWLVVKWSCKLVWLVVKGFLYLFGVRFAKKIKDPEPLQMVFDDTPRGDEAVVKVGSIVPVEEDPNLRTFNILNAEGEIYRINTALPGPFYGPVWTRIIGCCETQQTLCGRLIKPVYGQNNGQLGGYAVNIGKVKAFLPVGEAVFAKEHKPINFRMAVTAIDPITKKVTVSARRAYQIVLGKKTMGQAGQETDAIYWDYDDEFVYLLLPGEYIGQAPADVAPSQLAERMGTLTRCRIETVNADDQTAIVSLNGKGKDKQDDSAGAVDRDLANDAREEAHPAESEDIFDLEMPDNAVGA